MILGGVWCLYFYLYVTNNCLQWIILKDVNSNYETRTQTYAEKGRNATPSQWPAQWPSSPGLHQTVECSLLPFPRSSHNATFIPPASLQKSLTSCLQNYTYIWIGKNCPLASNSVSMCTELEMWTFCTVGREILDSQWPKQHTSSET